MTDDYTPEDELVEADTDWRPFGARTIARAVLVALVEYEIESYTVDTLESDRAGRYGIQIEATAGGLEYRVDIRVKESSE
jgi:hypothetical protein